MRGYHVCVYEVDDVPDATLEDMELIGSRTAENSSITVVEILLRKRKNWLKEGKYVRFRGIKKYTKRFVQERYKWFESKIDALEEKEKLISEIAELNHCVLNNNPRKYCVYIVDLHEDVMKNKMFKRENEDCGFIPIRYLYIGQTSESPEKRLDAHINNPKTGSKIVRKNKPELARDLMEIHSKYDLTEREALVLEESLTIELRNKDTRFATYSK
jgi:hypothetical protein